MATVNKVTEKTGRNKKNAEAACALLQRAFFILLLVLVSFQSQAILYRSVTSGGWNTVSTWTNSSNLSQTPSCGDSIVILASHTVSIPSTGFSCNTTKLVLIIYGTLSFPAGRHMVLPCNSYVSVMTGGQIISVGGGLSSSIDICNSVDVWTSTNGTAFGPACFPSTITPCFAVLPIKLKFFNSQVCGSHVCHTWESASEKNCKNYCIEKSEDGLHFTTLACIDSKAEGGTSQDDLRYSFEERNAGRGQAYYRLKQTDIDGSFEYFELTTVNQQMMAMADFELRPNPSSGKVLIHLHQSYPYFEVQVYDYMGRYVQRYEAENTDQLHLQINQRGLYSCQVKLGTQTLTHRLVIE